MVTSEAADGALASLCGQLRLKKHLVAVCGGCRGPEESFVMMHGPADMETHRGTDGRLYILDAARFLL